MTAAEFCEQILDSPLDVDRWETIGVAPVFRSELERMLPSNFAVTEDETRSAVVVARTGDDLPSSAVKPARRALPA